MINKISSKNIKNSKKTSKKNLKQKRSDSKNLQGDMSLAGEKTIVKGARNKVLEEYYEPFPDAEDALLLSEVGISKRSKRS